MVSMVLKFIKNNWKIHVLLVAVIVSGIVGYDYINKKEIQAAPPTLEAQIHFDVNERDTIPNGGNSDILNYTNNRFSPCNVVESSPDQGHTFGSTRPIYEVDKGGGGGPTSITGAPDAQPCAGSSAYNATPLVLVTPAAFSSSSGTGLSKLDFTINNGAPTTTSSLVSLGLNADSTKVTGYVVSLDQTFPEGIRPYPSTTNTGTFQLPNKFGTYVLYLRYYSSTGSRSDLIAHSISYQPPSVQSQPATVVPRPQVQPKTVIAPVPTPVEVVQTSETPVATPVSQPVNVIVPTLYLIMQKIL